MAQAGAWGDRVTWYGRVTMARPRECIGKLRAKRGALRTAKELSRAKGKGVYIHHAEQHRPCAINLTKEG